MSVSNEEQLGVIRKVIVATQAAGLRVWLFGGWGLDAHLGRITRDHGDVEFWVERQESVASKTVLVAAGAVALQTQPPEEACEFIWDGVLFSTAYFDRHPDGRISLQGRQSDWDLPPDSFGRAHGILDGLVVPTMSVGGMLAMKEQFPTLQHGGPWRDKDRKDIATLRELLRGDLG